MGDLLKGRVAETEGDSVAVDVADPEPGPGEVVVRIGAMAAWGYSSLNPCSRRVRCASVQVALRPDSSETNSSWSRSSAARSASA